MLKQSKWKNLLSYQFENEEYTAIVLPNLGGKIASFVYKENQFEVLFQRDDHIYKVPSLYDEFERYDASGFDDAFPSVYKEIAEYDGKEIVYPDHGEIWSASMEHKKSGNTLFLSYKSAILPYKYEKKISLEKSGLHISYHITNMGEKPLSAIWVMHCLIRCEENMQLLFPNEVEAVENTLDSTVLGGIGTIHQFPQTTDQGGNSYRLDRVSPASTKKFEKYYATNKITNGCCGAYYPNHKMKFLMKYDAKKLPYLGFWVTEGGFRGDYNCALEPANGYYDSVKTALDNEKLYQIVPKKTLEFSIHLILKKQA